jgi:hypothetical protein
MPKRSGKPTKARTATKRPRDVNQLARSVMDRLEQIAEEQPTKNPAAVALGRKGGLKGGRSRMDSLTAEERRKLALKAAKARWGKQSRGT